ncbi:MAG: diaminopimelate decarboxylase [Candidatus Eremiobacteraeota bacterium]|nr:diaminopimelate decarboxylase [Candidatus Eremiobacteraeota bacterium]
MPFLTIVDCTPNYNAKQAVDCIESSARRAQTSERDVAHTVARFGTPLLVIDERRLRATMRRFRAAFNRTGWRCDVVYAAKALALKAIARVTHEEGLALDVCSEGELETAMRAGVPAARCILHGCAKTDRELELAVQTGAGFVVLDHRREIDVLARIARQAGRQTPVLVRVNPGVSAATKSQVQTGAPESKFGFPISDGQAIDAIQRVRESQALEFHGIHCHIGSQITELASYALEIERLADFAARVERELATRCSIINLGGGLGIAQGDDETGAPTPEAWASAIFTQLERRFADGAQPRPQLMVEPGRAIVARAGTTLYTIVVRKDLADGTVALIVDGGMSDNPRPALYEATYPVTIASRNDNAADGRYTIFGRHCETDLLFRNVSLANPQPGDILEVRNTGAYTYSMASNYNRFPRPAVVLIDGERARLIARREPLEHLLDLDVLDE